MTLPGWARNLVRLLALNALIALGIVLLMAPFERRPFLAVFERYFAVNFVISNCIGLLCGAIFPLTARLMRDRPPWQGLPAVVLQLLLISAAGCWIAIELVEWLWKIRLDLWEIYRVGAIITVSVGAVIAALETYRRRVEAANLEIKHRQVEQERALQLAAAAKLSSIESRIQPHFLFNALNSISSLIREDPERAESLVGQLSSLLRGSLDTHQESLIPLDRELSLVRNYLEIQRARFESRLRYEIAVDHHAGESLVPPFSIQTLVENSVKFAVAPRREGGSISITVRRDGRSLTVEVADDGPGFDSSCLEPGHGLDNLSARLASLFGGGASLHIRSRGDGAGAIAGFTLPLEIHARVSG